MQKTGQGFPDENAADVSDIRRPSVPLQESFDIQKTPTGARLHRVRPRTPAPTPVNPPFLDGQPKKKATRSADSAFSSPHNIPSAS